MKRGDKAVLIEEPDDTPPVHLMPTRGDGSQCGGAGPVCADINGVTCEACIEQHDEIISEMEGVAMDVGDKAVLLEKPDGYTSRGYALTVGATYEILGFEGSNVITTTDEPGRTASYHRGRVVRKASFEEACVAYVEVYATVYTVENILRAPFEAARAAGAALLKRVGWEPSALVEEAARRMKEKPE